MTVATFLCSGQIYCQVCSLYPWSKSMALPETKVRDFLWCLISYLFQSTAADISSIWSCICRDFLLRPQVWWPQEMKSHSIHIIAGLCQLFPLASHAEHWKRGGRWYNSEQSQDFWLLTLSIVWQSDESKVWKKYGQQNLCMNCYQMIEEKSCNALEWNN